MATREQAAARFAEGRAVLEALALREAALAPSWAEREGGRAAAVTAEAAPLQRVIWVVMRAAGGEGAPPSRLLNQLLQAIKWQRTVAREAGEVTLNPLLLLLLPLPSPILTCTLSPRPSLYRHA